MVPPLTLERPVDRVHAPVGNDGLTDTEREGYAAAYRLGAARPLDEAEHEAMAQWLAKRDQR
ncbi:hypothetical protein [Mycetocola miduiensis]|uniref:hypothetical protein n=1 Tax=Mycetocola miduiensis TaxID=995034 RepID=UPI001160267F|nr:hypothetical protein [Mycetocola miduiensis]